MNELSLMSNIPDATQSAQLGIARGIWGLNRDAQVVAQSVTGASGDVTAALGPKYRTSASTSRQSVDHFVS
jgi:hypothetical protein